MCKYVFKVKFILLSVALTAGAFPFDVTLISHESRIVWYSGKVHYDSTVPKYDSVILDTIPLSKMECKT